MIVVLCSKIQINFALGGDNIVEVLDFFELVVDGVLESCEERSVPGMGFFDTIGDPAFGVAVDLPGVAVDFDLPPGWGKVHVYGQHFRAAFG